MLIEDFIDFDLIMPHADVYVTNAGYGGVMMSIQHHLPMVTAGVHEGKNEIATRAGYFRLGQDLATEKPTPKQIRKAVETVLADPQYRQNVIRLSEEFSRYEPNRLCETYLTELMRESAGHEVEVPA